MANVDENINRFMNAKERARKLIQMDANGTIDEYKKKAKDEGRMTYGDGGVVETSIMEHKTQDFNAYNNVQPQSFQIKNSKLPIEILESFKNKQIDTTPFGASQSVLDKIGIPVQQPQQRQVVTETVQVQQQPQVTTTVDYSMIKMIVEECMRKYTSALKKQILSESKTVQQSEGTLQAMKIGNKFSFIDSKGNVYEATLKKIKNINEKES